MFTVIVAVAVDEAEPFPQSILYVVVVFGVTSAVPEVLVAVVNAEEQNVAFVEPQVKVEP